MTSPLGDFPSVEQAIKIAAKLAPSKFQDQAQYQNQKSQPPTESPIAKRLLRDPEHLLSMLTEKESVFSRHTIAKVLSTYISDPEEYQAAYQTIITSNKLVQLTPEKELKTKARYSTREMVELEQKLMDDVRYMAHTSSFRVPSRKVELAIRITDKKLQAEAGVELSAEQRKAIRHITSDSQLSCVIGVAGAGKSTILAAAREAWEANGHRVFGAALAGKAAKGLEKSSGIGSRTLASFELSWQNEVNQLRQGDVLVIDEADMIGSRQMANFVTEAKNKGAKLVLVGDSEQLQPINAGAPFRAITEQIQPATLHEVHRQKLDWQKQASKDFALGRTPQALQAYIDHNKVVVVETHDDAVAVLASDYLNDFWATGSQPSRIALAHRKVDVKAINQTIREARIEAGELENGHIYKTEHGSREFAAGDRILFTRNNREVGVKNGMLGLVTKTDQYHLTVKLDDKVNGQSTIRTISIQDYADIEHGYATTIHKSQGATVDKSYFLASMTLDRHLTYVAMTRHRQDTKLYVDQEDFSCHAQLSAVLSRKRQKQSTQELSQNHSHDDLEQEAFKAKRRSQSQGPRRRRSKARDGREFGI